MPFPPTFHIFATSSSALCFELGVPFILDASLFYIGILYVCLHHHNKLRKLMENFNLGFLRICPSPWNGILKCISRHGESSGISGIFILQVKNLPLDIILSYGVYAEQMIHTNYPKVFWYRLLSRALSPWWFKATITWTFCRAVVENSYYVCIFMFLSTITFMPDLLSIWG